MKTATKTSSIGNNSPYVEMANNMSEALNQMVQNSLHQSEVANLFLRAVTSDNPDFRYIVEKMLPCLLKQEETCLKENL